MNCYSSHDLRLKVSHVDFVSEALDILGFEFFGCLLRAACVASVQQVALIGAIKGFPELTINLQLPLWRVFEATTM